MDKFTAKQNIKKALIQAIQTAGHRGFLQSQRVVPVKSGDLKKSGSDKNLDDGISITYTKEYASFVHDGVPPGEVSVKAYRRQGYRVKSFTYYSRGIIKNPFLEKSLTASFLDFSDDFDKSLKSNLSEAKITKE